jgi:hypothetical protein
VNFFTLKALLPLKRRLEGPGRNGTETPTER